jgi:hypothetical protein
MGIALFTVSGLFSPFQALMSWLAPNASARPAARHCALGRSPQPDMARGLTQGTAHAFAPPRSMLRSHAIGPQRRPLRVLRLVENNAAPAAAGRMRISGRMADVCAELDRLAAKEAAQHSA